MVFRPGRHRRGGTARPGAGYRLIMLTRQALIHTRLRGDPRYASGLDAVMVGWPVLIRIVYLLVRRILGLAVLALCGDMYESLVRAYGCPPEPSRNRGVTGWREIPVEKEAPNLVTNQVTMASGN